MVNDSAAIPSVSPPVSGAGQQTYPQIRPGIPSPAAPTPTPAPTVSVPGSTPIPQRQAAGGVAGSFQGAPGPASVSTSGVKITPYDSKSRKKGMIKLALLILLPIGLAVGGALTVSRYFAENVYQQQKGVLLAIPMQNTNWQDLGVVFEPLVALPIKTTTGFQTNKFLLDSGAVISSLPRDWADKMGLELAFLQRSTFRGFGGKTSFAYRGDMMVLLGEQEVSMPVVFTEASGTKSLLGRKGFFENYSIYFNHKERQIEIRE